MPFPHPEPAMLRSAIVRALAVPGLWFLGFLPARRGRPRLFRGIFSHVTERWFLFVIAAVGALTATVSGWVGGFPPGGETLLFLAAALTIKRQGYRVGSKRMERWEYRDELVYGALGDMVVMLLVAATAATVTGGLKSIALAMMVVPIGLIAISDEPLYGNEERHALRGLIRIHRRRNGVLDQAW